MTQVPNAHRQWTTGEIAELSRRYYTESTASLAERFGRTPQAIRCAAVVFIKDKQKNAKNVWAPDEEFILATLINKGLSSDQCSEQLGRTPGAVRHRASQLGLKFRSRPYHKWTLGEIERVRQAAEGGMSLAQIAREFGIEYRSVRCIAIRYKIKSKRGDPK